ncbi:MAG: pullulanase-associated domain-containing protein, partial [Candidatus Izemoplasmataceae bacterium]
MRTFRRVIFAMLMVVGMFAAANVNLHAETAEELIVHYFRYDDDYSEYDTLWLWPYEPDSESGNEYVFDEEDDYGVKQTIDLSETNLYESTTIGLIMYTGDWDEPQDVSGDRYVDMTNPNSDGEVHVYLVQGEETIYYEESEANTSHRILSSSLQDESTVDFSATTDADAEDVSVNED